LKGSQLRLNTIPPSWRCAVICIWNHHLRRNELTVVGIENGYFWLCKSVLLTYRKYLALFLNFFNLLLIAKSTRESQLQFFENKKTDLGQKTDHSFVRAPKWCFTLPVEIRSCADHGNIKSHIRKPLAMTIGANRNWRNIVKYKIKTLLTSLLSTPSYLFFFLRDLAILGPISYHRMAHDVWCILDEIGYLSL
jgi:hypothetical protein